MLALIWREERQPLRWAFVLLGGLSSVIVIPLLPLFAARALWERRRHEWITLVLVLITVAVQFFAMNSWGGAKSTAGTLSFQTVRLGVQVFVGGFLQVGSWAPLALVALIWLTWLARQRLDRYFLFLVGMWTATCAAAALRIDLTHMINIAPALSGPRYSFYPFILFSWALIWLAAISSSWVRAIVVIAFAVAITPALPHMQRRHDHLNWRAELSACLESREPYTMRTHMDGVASRAFPNPHTAEECRKLISRSLF